MKKVYKAFITLTVAVCLLSGAFSALAADGFDYSYTYTYDYWGDIRQSPNSYRTRYVLNSASLGLEKRLENPQGLFVRNDSIFICDTGNHRIIEVKKAENGFAVERIITNFNIPADSYSGPDKLASPYDIYVSETGDMFIADYGNNRIVKLDKDLNLLTVFTRPNDPTFDSSLAFLPTKLVADSVGRAYVIAKNVNKGIIKYEKSGTFTGFIGANEVKPAWYELLWRNISTKEQRAQQTAFVPTEYDNISIDEKGFFYVVTKTFDTEELLDGGAKPIRRLNAVGSNILVENGNYWSIGDIQWADPNGDVSHSGPSLFIDITALKNGIYVALDSTHSRLFSYDAQGNMLWAFGGIGNKDGFFRRPVAIDHMGNDLVVLDSLDCAVTVMTPTDYGEKVYKAIDLYYNGEYVASADAWTEVLAQNGNCDLAYIGVGRALLQQERYEEALPYFKIARDAENYSEAWRFYRKQWVEERVGWVFGIVFALLLLPPIIRKIRKIKREVDAA